MSMNLKCNKMELWQTPTHVTYMCMMTSKGVADEFTGKKARRALKIYQQWVSSCHPMQATTSEEEEAMKDGIRTCQEHIQQVEEVMKRKNLVVTYI